MEDTIISAIATIIGLSLATYTGWQLIKLLFGKS